ncbi:MAG: hypothetical protein ACP5PJ_09785 [Acidimicrobiales bacterium]
MLSQHAFICTEHRTTSEFELLWLRSYLSDAYGRFDGASPPDESYGNPIYARCVPELSIEERQREVRAAILGWSASNPRDLPWRRSRRREPWEVLVSEFMLIQTQASRVALTFPRFINRFATPHQLAQSTIEEVLAEWMGLGYYRRARALRDCAIELVEHFDGKVPSRYEELISLPGIGPYIANAVRALAFDYKVGAVDTNVRRILSRTLGLPSTTKASTLQSIADDLAMGTSPGEWTEALFDFGASVCRNQSPNCRDCPLGNGLCTSAHSSSVRINNTPRLRTQSRFVGSRRQLRGLILRHLTDTSSDPVDRLMDEASAFGFDHAHVSEVASQLLREGLICALPDRLSKGSVDRS